MERVACEEKVQHVMEKVIRDVKARLPKGSIGRACGMSPSTATPEAWATI